MRDTDRVRRVASGQEHVVPLNSAIIRHSTLQQMGTSSKDHYRHLVEQFLGPGQPQQGLQQEQQTSNLQQQER